MDQALEKIGLPVKCRKCRKAGNVIPRTDYGGWYKSKILRMRPNKWFCPEHAQIGSDMDDNFYMRYATPEPKPIVQTEETVEDLYKLLD